MADSYCFKIDKGATWKQELEWQDENGVAIDLTGYTAKMQLRKNYDSDVIHELTTENGGITIATPTFGIINLLIEVSVSKDFTNTKVLYDLELYKNDEVVRLLEGTFIINENVTI